MTGDSTSSSDNDYDVHWTSLQYAGSIASAARQMEDNLFGWYRDAGGGRKDMYATDNQSDEDAAIKQNATLASQSGGEDCFWIFSAATKTSGTSATTFLWNHAGNPKISQGNDFVDVAYSDYFHNAVKWAGFVGTDAGNEHALRHLHGLCGV